MLLLMSVGSWTFYMFQCSAIPSWGVGREDGVVRWCGDRQTCWSDGKDGAEGQFEVEWSYPPRQHTQ